jgi:hypothetical protein
VLLQPGDTVAVPDEGALRVYAGAVSTALARADRCRVEVVEREGQSRYLVHNWRRAPGAAPKRILL